MIFFFMLETELGETIIFIEWYFFLELYILS